MKIRGYEQSVIFVINRNCPHDIGMATMQHADKLADGFPVLQVHAIFAGDREWFYDAGTSIFQLTLQVVIAMHNKKILSNKPIRTVGAVIRIIMRARRL